MLSDGAVVPLSEFTETSYQSGDLAPFTLSTQTVAPNGYITVSFTAADPVQIGCSDARPKFCTLDGAPVAGTEGTVGLYGYDAPFPDPDGEAIVDSPAGSHTVTFQIIPAATTEGITEEDNAQGQPVGYAGPWIVGSYGSGIYSSAQPFNIVGEADVPSFVQQPSNSAAGDTIKPPVTVAIQTNGVTDPTVTDSITLALASGSGKLTGTLTEPTVAGVATFSDLSIDTGGTYTITATDGSTAPVLSSAFDISAGKLVFTKAPHSGSAGQALNPAVIVSLEDGSGKVVTDDSSTVVTLSPIGVNGNAAITGNTVTLVNGVATFSNVKLAQPGFYQLQATDGGDTQATSGKFKIAGDKLKFLKQPRSSDVDTPLPLTVKIIDSHGKLVTDATSSIVLSLNTVSGGTNAVLSGTSTLAFVGGVATFTANSGPMINVVGNYTLTATEEDTTTGVLAPTNTTTAIASARFGIAGYKLVVTHQPNKVDVFDPVPLTIALKSTHGGIDKLENTAQVQLSLTTITGGDGAVIQGTTVATFINGVATFKDTGAPTINGGGTFTLTATEIGSSNPAAPADTKNIVVLPDILRPDTKINSKQYLALRGSQVVAGGGVTGQQYILQVYSAQGKLQTSSGLNGKLPDELFTVIPVSAGAAVDHSFDILGPLQIALYPDSNAADFALTEAKILPFETPGSYRLMANPTLSPDSGASNANAAISALKLYTSPLLKVVDPVIIGRLSARSVSVGETLTATAHLYLPNKGDPIEDAASYLFTNPSDGIRFDLRGVGSDESYVQALPIYENASLDLGITKPGRYQLVMSVVYTPGDPNVPFNNLDNVPATGLASLTVPFVVTK